MTWRESQTARRLPAKPLQVGSTPAGAFVPLDDKQRLPAPKPVRLYGLGPFLSNGSLSFNATRGPSETPGMQRICSAVALRPLRRRMVNRFWFTFYYRRARGRSRARSGLIS
jgi:hypothetical protein